MVGRLQGNPSTWDHFSGPVKSNPSSDDAPTLFFAGEAYSEYNGYV